MLLFLNIAAVTMMSYGCTYKHVNAAEAVASAGAASHSCFGRRGGSHKASAWPAALNQRPTAATLLLQTAVRRPKQSTLLHFAPNLQLNIEIVSNEAPCDLRIEPPDSVALLGLSFHIVPRFRRPHTSVRQAREQVV